MDSVHWTPGLREICLKGLIPKQSIFVDINALPSFLPFSKARNHILTVTTVLNLLVSEELCIFFANPKHSRLDNINRSVQNFIAD